MPTTVTILYRNRIPILTGPNQSREAVQVSYRTATGPLRLIYVPSEHYRDATAEEYPAGGPITVVPKDDAGQAAEDEAIRQDMAAAAAFTAPTREI